MAAKEVRIYYIGIYDTSGGGGQQTVQEWRGKWHTTNAGVFDIPVPIGKAYLTHQESCVNVKREVYAGFCRSDIFF